MSLHDKVVKIITDDNLHPSVEEFIDRVKKEILKGVGQEMIKEQKLQTERFLASLNIWDKMIEEKIAKIVEEKIAELARP